MYELSDNAKEGDQSRQLFRQEALNHRFADQDEGRVLEVAPRGIWLTLVALTVLLVGGIVLASILEYKLRATAPGILRPASGVRVAVARQTGEVAEVDVAPGQIVKAGASLVRLTSLGQPSLHDELERLHSLESALRDSSMEADRAYAERRAALQARHSVAVENISSLETSAELSKKRLQAVRALQRQGLLSQLNIDEAGDAFEQAERQLRAGRQSALQLQQELASLEGERSLHLQQRTKDIEEARARKNALLLRSHEAVILAPISGSVDSVLVKAGDVLQVGQAAVKIVPKEEPLKVVSFLFERYLGRVRVGEWVDVALDQASGRGYDYTKAKIHRISDDPATPSEVRTVLGEDSKLGGPAYVMELEIQPVNGTDRNMLALRNGMRVEVQFVVERKRLIESILEPLNRILPSSK